MRISVIIPVFNEEKSIAATLQGLERLKPDELIVVDGGSSDGTREVCQAFGVELYATPKGRARQMNFGAQTSHRRRARLSARRHPASAVCFRRYSLGASRIGELSAVVSIFNWTLCDPCSN